MNPIVKKALAGAVSGFLASFLVDLNAWSHSTPDGMPNAPFNWNLAIKRWGGGAIAGAAAAFGISEAA